MVACRGLQCAAQRCTQDGPTAAVRPQAEAREPGDWRRAFEPQTFRPPELRCSEDAVEAQSLDLLALGESVREGAITDLHGEMRGLLLRTPHPECTLLCMVDAAKNWKKARILDQKVVLNPPEILDVFCSIKIPDDTDFRSNTEYPGGADSGGGDGRDFRRQRERACPDD